MSDFLKLEDLNLSSVVDSEINIPVNLSQEDREVINILLPRMSKSDLKDALGFICNLAAKTPGPDLEEIGELLISYRKAKVLIENKAFDFNIGLKGLLYKELEQSLIKANSVVSLLNFQSNSQDAFQKKKSAPVLMKNEYLIERYQREMDLLKQEIEFNNGYEPDKKEDSADISQPFDSTASDSVDIFSSKPAPVEGVSTPISELIEKNEPDPYVSEEFTRSIEAYATDEPSCDTNRNPIESDPKPYEGFNYIKTLVNMIADHDRSVYLYNSITLATTYKRICGFFHIPCEDNENDIAKNIFNNNAAGYIENYFVILNTYVVTKEVEAFINSLIKQMQSFSECVNLKFEDLSGIPESHLSIVKETNDYPTKEDIESVCFKVRLLNKDGVTIDEANYKNSDFENAISDFNYYKAPIKRVGIILEKKTVFLYEVDDNGNTIMILSDDTRKENGFDTGIAGKVIDHYLEKIGNALKGMF